MEGDAVIVGWYKQCSKDYLLKLKNSFEMEITDAEQKVKNLKRRLELLNFYLEEKSSDR